MTPDDARDFFLTPAVLSRWMPCPSNTETINREENK